MLLIELLYFFSALLLALYGFAAVLYTGLYWKYQHQVKVTARNERSGKRDSADLALEVTPPVTTTDREAVT